jgi:predicted DNA-binding transcriptional regulator AlpA
MTGVSIVETETLMQLVNTVESLKSTVIGMAAELKDTKKPYLSAQEVMAITGFGKTWLNDNKQDIGFSIVGGSLRFKRKDLEEYMEQNYFKTKRRK